MNMDNMENLWNMEKMFSPLFHHTERQGMNEQGLGWQVLC